MTKHSVLRTIRRTVFYLFVVAVVVGWAFPVLWIIASSFKPDRLIISQTITYFFTPTLEHYGRIFTTHNFGRFLLDSLVVAISTTLIVGVTGFMAAYSLSRFKTGGPFANVSLFITRIAPPAAVLMPYFMIFKITHLINNLGALIIVNLSLNLSFAILMLRTFIDEISISIEEAAEIEGASWSQILWQIVFPLSRPGILTTSIFTFIFTWNEYLYALVLASSNRVKTLPVAAGDFITAYAIEWGPVFSSGTLILLPILVMTFIVQKYIVRGLTFGAIK